MDGFFVCKLRKVGNEHHKPHDESQEADQPPPEKDADIPSGKNGVHKPEKHVGAEAEPPAVPKRTKKRKVGLLSCANKSLLACFEWQALIDVTVTVAKGRPRSSQRGHDRDGFSTPRTQV